MSLSYGNWPQGKTKKKSIWIMNKIICKTRRLTTEQTQLMSFKLENRTVNTASGTQEKQQATTLSN